MKYKVGDEVRVKEWKDLVETGSLHAGDIRLNGSQTFVHRMKSCCGKIFTITDLNSAGYRLDNKLDWYFDDWMLESADEKHCAKCKHFHSDDDEYPCVECKHTMLPDSKKYKSAPDLWEEIESEDDLYGGVEKDVVNHPRHYTNCSLECIDVMTLWMGKAGVVEFCLGNAFKYIWRYKNKNGLEDLNKAEWYLNKAREIDDEHIIEESRYKTICELVEKIKALEECLL